MHVPGGRGTARAIPVRSWQHHRPPGMLWETGGDVNRASRLPWDTVFGIIDRGFVVPLYTFSVPIINSTGCSKAPDRGQHPFCRCRSLLLRHNLRISAAGRSRTSARRRRGPEMCRTEGGKSLHPRDGLTRYLPQEPVRVQDSGHVNAPSSPTERSSW